MDSENTEADSRYINAGLCTVNYMKPSWQTAPRTEMSMTAEIIAIILPSATISLKKKHLKRGEMVTYIYTAVEVYCKEIL